MEKPDCKNHKHCKECLLDSIGCGEGDICFNEGLERMEKYYEALLRKKDEEIDILKRLNSTTHKSFRDQQTLRLRLQEENKKLNKLHLDTCMLEGNTEAKRMKEILDLKEDIKSLKRGFVERLRWIKSSIKEYKERLIVQYINEYK